MWHERTEALRESGDLAMVGLIQEQHPDRCRLFMQWHEMDWPVMVDSLDLLGVSAVPIPVLIDEYGVVRSVRPDWDEVQTFAAGEIDEVEPAEPTRKPDLEALERAAESGEAEHLAAFADALVMWGGPDRLNVAIAAYQRAIKARPGHGPTHFKLGVAFRKRFESEHRQDGDFAAAIEHWGKALEIDPNQYIWRRRIQQYGPRLDKPYSFYDWVREAREAIRERGDAPVELRVEPGGAEFAYPAESFEDSGEAEEPDPEGRITRDEGFIDMEAVGVPATGRGQRVWRVHLLFRPSEAADAHWNNEAEPMRVWIEPLEGWRVDRRLVTLEAPRAATSEETRTVEVELRPPEGGADGAPVIAGHALYNVCEGEDGVCLFRRLDFRVPVERHSGGGD